LQSADFRGVRLVAFCGVSGAGKSTAIDFVRRRPEFCQREGVVASPAGVNALGHVRGRLVVVEELLRPGDLRCVWRLLRGGATVLAASHLRPAWLAPFRLLAPMRCYQIDRDWQKIARYLDRCSVAYTPAAVQQYCRRYGANYVDAGIVLERFPGVPFDEALARFERFCRLDVRPTENGAGCQTAPLD